MERSATGICWPRAATVGHITVTTTQIAGQFPSTHGEDAIVDCVLTAAGKYRNGAARAWCRTHQRYWGVKADLAAFDLCGIKRCAQHADPMDYVLDPPVIEISEHEQVSIFPAAPDGIGIATRQAGVGNQPAARHRAIGLACRRGAQPFAASGIVQINITPPALAAWAMAVRSGQPLGCIDCARCGHPHLDLGSFAERAHRRHYCGHCGHDATHSAGAIISHPFFSLLRLHGTRLSIEF